MNTKEIRHYADKLDGLRKSLTDLKQERTLLNCNGHQTELSVSAGAARKVIVGHSGYDTGYMTKIIRGREMILLGMIKTFDGWIAQREKEVAECEAQLASLIGEKVKP